MRGSGRVVLLVIGALLLVEPIWAQGVLPPFSLRVRLRVTASEDLLKDQVSSYLLRELRSIPGVVVAEDDYRFGVEVVAMEVLSKGRINKLGYALAVVVTRNLEDTMRGRTLQKCLVDLQMGDVSKMFDMEGTDSFETVWLQTGSAEDLREMCEGVVASFDSQYVERSRKSWQWVQETVEKRQKPR